MKNVKYFLVIILPIFLDLFTTYLVTKGDLSSRNEFHFAVQLFGFNFFQLALFFLVYALVLYGLFTYSQSKSKNQRNTTSEYKILKIKRGGTRFSKEYSAISLKKSLPIMVFLMLCGHFMAAVNNFLIFLYQENASFLRPLHNAYVNFVFIQGRAYLVYIFILLGMGIFLFFRYFILRKNSIQNKVLTS